MDGVAMADENALMNEAAARGASGSDASTSSHDHLHPKAKKASVTKAKKTVTKRKTRKAVKKKPDDMPRRPLSAYNYFFSDMRSKLVAERAEGQNSEFQEFLAKQSAADDGAKKNGFFSNMGKFVAKRWKELSEEEMKPYTEKADEDLERYRREMDEYREGVARKTRLASEKKLREQDSSEVKGPEIVPEESPQASPAALQAASATGQPWAAAAQPTLQQQLPHMPQLAAGQGVSGHPSIVQPAALDPTYQLLLRQQLLNGAQNPQLSALLLQQQLMSPHHQPSAGGGGLPMGVGGYHPHHMAPAAGGYGQMLGAQSGHPELALSGMAGGMLPQGHHHQAHAGLTGGADNAEQGLYAQVRPQFAGLSLQNPPLGEHFAAQQLGQYPTSAVQQQLAAQQQQQHQQQHLLGGGGAASYGMLGSPHHQPTLPASSSLLGAAPALRPGAELVGGGGDEVEEGTTQSV